MNNQLARDTGVIPASFIFGLLWINETKQDLGNSGLGSSLEKVALVIPGTGGENPANLAEAVFVATLEHLLHGDERGLAPSCRTGNEGTFFWAKDSGASTCVAS